MTETDAQVRIMMREREKGRTQEQAAASANVSSRKTVAKYERLGKLPSEVAHPRGYRTRPDPFTEDWATVERMLERAPSLEGKDIYPKSCTSGYCVKLTSSGKCVIIETAKRRQTWQSDTQRSSSSSHGVAERREEHGAGGQGIRSASQHSQCLEEHFSGEGARDLRARQLGG